MANLNLFVRLVWLLTVNYGVCSSEAWTSENNLEELEDDIPRFPYARETKTTHRMTLYSENDGRKTSNIDDIVAGIIKEAELSNPVVLRSWRVNPPPTDHKTVSVDSTVVNLLVEVHSKGVSPRFQVYDPTGEVVSPTDDRNITMEVNSNRLKIMKIKHPITGDWLIRFPSKRHEYNVTIRGSSMIQFRCRFINGWGIPLSGRPIVASNVTLRIELLGGEDVNILTEVTLMTLVGTTILTRPLGKARGRRHRTYAAHIRIPGEDFRVGIRGLDMRSNVIERTLMNPIVPDGIKLSLKALTPGTVQTGGSYVLQYRIVNDGTGAGNFTVTALSDTPYLTFTVTPDCVYLKAGDHAQGNVTVHVSEYAVPGTKSDVIVRATNTSGNFQFSSREVSIVSPPNDEDTHAPAFSTTNIIDNCDSAQSSTWEVIFQVQDDESGIHKVDVDDHTVSTITMETFDDGQANMPVKGHLSIQCSRKEVTVIVDDVEGNEGRFLVTHGRHQGTTSSYVSIKGEMSSEAHITAICTGILAGCLFLTILVTVTIQIKMRLTHRRNVVYAKTENKVPCTSRRMDMQVF
ncbi:uncharacterized protein LOC110442641 [Mizuhopecten yessoensis]|uniref:Uncharacterized protein n=1 Tax=Mizuhopecten yessoensis TaxID=6573 RepID=A0A210PGT4_MIZYE|nr:uncharacterized protein LOC110442641 [Mizuhopecten yessoensis]OWF35698.1 hypothetical protein KP79_PYT04906 [Mizuhopecten yessoensis]